MLLLIRTLRRPSTTLSAIVRAARLRGAAAAVRATRHDPASAQLEPERGTHHGPHHDRRLSCPDPQPLRAHARGHQPRAPDQRRLGAAASTRDRDKPTVIALREIAAGKVGIEMLLKRAELTLGRASDRQRDQACRKSREFTRHLGHYLPPPDVALVERAFDVLRTRAPAASSASPASPTSRTRWRSPASCRSGASTPRARRGAAARRDGGHQRHQDRDRDVVRQAGRRHGRRRVQARPDRVHSRARTRRPRTSARCCWRWRRTSASS